MDDRAGAMWCRRRFLGAALGGAALVAPERRLWAQPVGASAAARQPRSALVIGNAGYRQAALLNPGNDARGMAEALRDAGFDVSVHVDAGRAAMRAAIDTFVRTLASRKGVGLFYFAGHGVQLDWRNHLLPVDAEVASNDDVHRQSVEVGSLLQGLARVGNALNIVILDACRDAPFGTTRQPEQRGLSQMDAPVGTLLAYATAPGHIASDGDGPNGLYTGNLLREMRAPGAKVEDVFKRVRLSVRLGSKGRQIPWESTSLEGDFYFLPPRERGPLGDDGRERLFDEELAQWERAKSAREPGPLEAYLRRYPNGEFSELAQHALDRVLASMGERRIDVASPAGNPYSVGYARADTDFKVGDYYRYRVLDLETRAQIRMRPGTITAVTDAEVVFGKGTLVLDRMGNTLRTGDGLQFTDNQNMPLEFYVGRKWTTQYRSFSASRPEAAGATVEVEYRIPGREAIQVPAGTFDCFRVEGRGRIRNERGRTGDLRFAAWFAPDRCRRPVVQEIQRTPVAGSRVPAVSERHELVEFRQT